MPGDNPRRRFMVPGPDIFATLDERTARLRRGETGDVVLLGSSMWPLLPAGSRLTPEPVDPAAIRVGDVILFERGPWLIAHRVVHIEPSDRGPVFITRGDHVQLDDFPITTERLVGRVRRHGPLTGLWLIAAPALTAATCWAVAARRAGRRLLSLLRPG